MDDTFEHRIRRIMSGETRGVAAASARAGLRAAEPLYGAIARLRNGLFDRGTLRGNRLPRPVVSIGNLTTGGTGKTPAVQWLVRRMVAGGLRPAVLMRGYQREAADAASDEELVLRESLGGLLENGVPVVADPDRAAAGLAALDADPKIDAFVLDDGFQHRRLHRDCDVVLIDATNPFGYGHVLPRGMLREPISGLARADVVLLTRTGGIDVGPIEREIRRHQPRAPIVRSDHHLGPAIDVDGQPQPLADARVLAFSGIGNPAAFERGLVEAGATLVATRRFADHHRYDVADALALRVAALNAGAAAMVTTEKDWVKVRTLDPAGPGVPTWRVGVALHFAGVDESTAWRTIAVKAALPTPLDRPPRAADSMWTE